MWPALIGLLGVLTAIGSSFVCASPMYRAYEPNRHADIHQNNEVESLVDLPPLPGSFMDEHSSSNLHGSHSDHFGSSQYNMPDDFERLGISSQPSYSTLDSTHSQYEWQQQHHHPGAFNDFHYGTNVDHSWSQENEMNHQYTTNTQSLSHSGNSPGSQSASPNPFDANMLGGTSSSIGDIWDQMHHKARHSMEQETSTSHQDELPSVMQELEEHLGLNPLSDIIPENSVFDVEELTRNLTPEEIQEAQKVALRFPPKMLTGTQRKYQRAKLKNLGFPLKTKIVGESEEETKQLRRQKYNLTKRAKRLEIQLAKQLDLGKSEEEIEEGEGSHTMEDSDGRLGTPPPGVTKEAYRYLYISPEEIASLDNVQRAALFGLYNDFPLYKELPPYKSPERRSFDYRRQKLLRMGIPLPDIKLGRPLQDKEDAKVAEEKNKANIRAHMVRLRAQKKEMKRQTANGKRIDDNDF